MSALLCCSDLLALALALVPVDVATDVDALARALVLAHGLVLVPVHAIGTVACAAAATAPALLRALALALAPVVAGTTAAHAHVRALPHVLGTDVARHPLPLAAPPALPRARASRAPSHVISQGQSHVASLAPVLAALAKREAEARAPQKSDRYLALLLPQLTATPPITRITTSMEREGPVTAPAGRSWP